MVVNVVRIDLGNCPSFTAGMAASALLQSKLSYPPATQFMRRAIFEKMFSFSHWYEEQCNDRIGAVSTTTHSTLVDIVCFLKSRNKAKESIRKEIKAILPAYDDEIIDTLISLSARLWTMCCIGEIKQCLTLGQTLTWQDGSLPQLLASRFSTCLAVKEDVVLPKSFNAMSCEKVAGIRIRWTSNLLDHLKMTDEDQTVHIFHHAAFLELHKRVSRSASSSFHCHIWVKTHSSSETFPAGFLEETINTIALLLPRNNNRVRRWYQRRTDDLSLDPSAAECKPLSSSARRMRHFPYWGDRLSILKQAFDESEPRTLFQWWHDDRKRVQWYTFWVAILALFLTVTLGTVQCAASIVQAWASVKALKQLPSQSTKPG